MYALEPNLIYNQPLVFFKLSTINKIKINEAIAKRIIIFFIFII